MYYEVCLDVLFVLNMIMDFFLLRLVGLVLQKQVSRKRSLVGACLGAGGVCILILHPYNSLGNMILAYLVINTLMVRFGCNLKKIKDLLWGNILLYGVGFLMGGLVEFLWKMTGGTSVRIFFMIGGISYLILGTGLSVYEVYRKQTEKLFQFQLYANGKCKEGTALLDTGNSLKDTVSQKPVCIGETQLLEELLTEEMVKGLKNFSMGKESEVCFGSLNPRYIPFSSLGCSDGLAVAVTMDYLCLEGQKIHKVITHPVIAFSGKNNSFAGDYQMILHPNLINGQEGKLL